MKKWLLFGCGGLLGLTALLLIFMVISGISTYNSLVKLDQGVTSAWSEVENQYQRRYDLVPNLVETVKGAANFEKETLTAVTEARAKVGQVRQNVSPTAQPNPEQYAKFQQAQDQLSSALSRLMVVVEKYPELKATSQFHDLNVALEGTENRITVARGRFTEAVKEFNIRRKSFPTNLMAGFFGFEEKTYFKAQEGAANAPKVKF